MFAFLCVCVVCVLRRLVCDSVCLRVCVGDCEWVSVCFCVIYV